MRSPIIFFVIMIILDLILKSSKDKKKINKDKRKRMEEATRTPQEEKSVITVIREEIQKEIQRELGNMPKDPQKPRTVKPPVEKVHIKSKDIDWDDSIFEPRISKEKETKARDKKTIEKEETSTLEQDVLRGIIFSEILSPPKAIQNARKNM